MGAIAIGDVVRSTLGPHGMDKVLQSRGGGITVTNDGATILKGLELDNAAAKVLVNVAKVQDDETGDGTTSVCVLAAELLREADRLVQQKHHPQTVACGFRAAAGAALEALEAAAVECKRDDLEAIAQTTLSSKAVRGEREHFARLAVDAVLRVGDAGLSQIEIVKVLGGRLRDSFLDEGLILDKAIGVGQPKRAVNARVLVANTSMDTDKVKVFGARVRTESTLGLAEMEKAEKAKMRDKVLSMKALGVDCMVNRQLVYNFPEQLFADSGIIAVEHADFDGVERVARFTGAEIASTFNNVRLGHCELIEETIVAGRRMLRFAGGKGEACTIILRGATQQLLDEAERSVHDALSVVYTTLKDKRIVYGGGCSEMLMAAAVDCRADKEAGKQQAAIDAFARALRSLPGILAENAGLDPSHLVAQLRAAHHSGKSTFGLDLTEGQVGDMKTLNIIESFRCKSLVVKSAAEAAEMICRVDNILRAPRRIRK